MAGLWRRAGWRIPWVLVSLLLALCAGCHPDSRPPELLSLTELQPRSVVAGERVEVRGVGLPVGDATRAKVVFVGSLHRPGLPPEHGVEIEITDANVERDRIWFELNDTTAAHFTGGGGDARHATFRGSVEVWLPGTRHGLPVYGTLKGTHVLNVEPALAATGAGRELDGQATATLDHLGLSVDVGKSGVEISSVVPGGLAAVAELEVGDRLVRVGGLEVLSARDLVAADGTETLMLRFERGGSEREIELAVPSEVLQHPGSWITGVALLCAACLFVWLLNSRVGIAFSWLVHRLASRRRPQRADVAPTSAADAARAVIAKAAPLLVVCVTTATFALLAFAELSGRSALDVGVLYLVSLTSFVAMGLVTGAWSSGGGTLRRRLRGLLGLLAVELPALVALAVVVTQTGSLRVSDIVLAQSAGRGIEIGSFPWHWNALRSPQLFVLFTFFFIAVLVDNRAEQKAAGALDRGLFFFAEWTNTFVMCAIGAIAFLGGYAVPMIPMERLTSGGAWMALGVAVFVLKCWALAGVVLLGRVALPRLRVRTLLRLGLWRVVPAVLLVAAIAVMLHLFPLLPSTERFLSLTTLGMLLLTCGAAIVGVREQRAALASSGPRINTLL